MMKKQLLVFLLLICLAATGWANPKDWVDSQADKISHALAGGFIAGLSYKYGATPAGMVVNATLLGVAKETFDLKYGGQWDNGDILANIVGAVVFIIL